MAENAWRARVKVVATDVRGATARDASITVAMIAPVVSSPTANR